MMQTRPKRKNTQYSNNRTEIPLSIKTEVFTFLCNLLPHHPKFLVISFFLVIESET